MNDKLYQAFDELEFDVTDQIRNSAYLAEQRKVATGVTDGTIQRSLVRDLTENLRTLNTDYTYKDMLLDRIKDLEALVAKLEQRIKVLEGK